MVEIGGLAINVRESPIHGDAADETHSAWSVDLIGVSGRTATWPGALFEDGPIPAWHTNVITTISKPAGR